MFIIYALSNRDILSQPWDWCEWVLILAYTTPLLNILIKPRHDVAWSLIYNFDLASNVIHHGIYWECNGLFADTDSKRSVQQGGITVLYGNNKTQNYHHRYIQDSTSRFHAWLSPMHSCPPCDISGAPLVLSRQRHCNAVVAEPLTCADNSIPNSLYKHQ